MCENCPPPSPPTDPEAVRLASELIARCQLLLPSGRGTNPERDARNILIAASTFCRNALIAHAGGQSGDNMLRVAAHLSAMEIHGQAIMAVQKGPVPERHLPKITQTAADCFSEYVVSALSSFTRQGLSMLYEPPGPSKEAS